MIADLTRAVDNAAAREGFVLDDAQQSALPQLAAFLTGIETGLYLHGPAGRGKTWLVDVAIATVPGAVRMHLHAFLARFHPVLFGYRMRADPEAVRHALRDVLGDASLFVLDEFHTHDSGDARILTVVLQSLRDARVPVILTSNYPPERLLQDSVWAHTMAEAIQLISSEYAVLALDGGRDHRCARPGTGFHSGTWSVGTSVPAGSATIASSGRHFDVVSAGTPLIATFAQLCRAETSAIDFVSWAQKHAHWQLYGVPALADESPSAQQRFVTLVDVLADANIRLDMTTTLDREAFEGRAGTRPDAFRTLSRLRLLSDGDHFKDS